MRAPRLIPVFAVLAATPASAGDCERPMLHPQIAITEGATVPKDGGIVVFESTASRSSFATSGPIKDWQLVDGARRTTPRIRTLAPGLSVLEGTGDRLMNKRATLRTFRRGDVAEVTGPAATSVAVHRTRHGYRVNTAVRVELAKATTIRQFLVVFDQEGKVARSFGVAEPGATSVDVYAIGECLAVPAGTLPTRAGESIKLAWVDATGRISAQSAVLVVASNDSDRP